MGLADLFRPKWKHSDVEVRAAAVRELDADNVEILETIAKSDGDASIRRIAIKKLQDPVLLLALAGADADEGLRQFAAERGTSVLTARATSTDEKEALTALELLREERALADVAKGAPLEGVRRAALARLRDARALADVAKNARDPEVRLAAVKRVEDTGVLRGVALDEENREVATAALERIDDPEALEGISRRGKCKAVKVLARKRLGEAKAKARSSRPTQGEAGLSEEGSSPAKAADTPTAEAQRRARQEQMCRTLEALARSADFDRVGPQIEEAQAEWRELETGASEELRRRFSEAVSSFESRRAKIADRKAALVQKAQTLEASLGARLALVREAESLVGEAPAGRIEELRAAWERIGPVPEVHQETARRFERACTDARKKSEEKDAQLALEGELAELTRKVVALRDSPRPRQALRQLQFLEEEWRRRAAVLSADPLAQEIEGHLASVKAALEQREADEQVARDRHKQENLARLVALCDGLERLVQGTDWRAAERRVRDVQDQIRKPGPLPLAADEEALKTRFYAIRERVLEGVREQKEADEWRRWASIPKLEELCLRVEGLAGQKDPREASRKLREAQAEWRKVGPVPKEKSEAFWARFKKASDLVFESCQGYYAKLEEERGSNLQKKEELCTRVEALAESTDWAKTADEIKRTQGEWKAIGPVPKVQSDAVWKRFRAACDHFFEKRQEHLDRASGERSLNLTQKEELCTRVEALAESTDWAKTADEIKRIQSDWRVIGPVPRAQSDAVWKRFRAACDRFFGRRQEELDKEKVANQRRKEELIVGVEALLLWEGEGAPADASAQAEAARVLREAQEEWKRVGAVPQALSEELWERFCKACDAVVTAYPEPFRGTDLDPTINLRKREKLCARAEVLAGPEPGPEGSPSGSVEQMADRLRSALAANAFVEGERDEKTEGEAIVDEIHQLQQTWRRLGPVPRDEGSALWDRFRIACDRVLQRAKPQEAESNRGTDDQERLNFDRKQALLMKAEELAARAITPEGRDEVKRIQRQWKGIGPVPKVKAKTLWNRFRKACNRVLSEGGKAKPRADAADEVEGASRDETEEQTARSEASDASEDRPGLAPEGAAPATCPAEEPKAEEL